MKVCLLNAQSVISLQQRLKLLNFLSFHSPDLVFVTETWLYPEIEDSEVCPLNCNYSIIARRDRSGGEHGGVLIAAKKDFCFNYSDLTHTIDRNMKIGQINDFAVAISITTTQDSHLFLLIYNPPSTSPYRIEASLLTDCISSCYTKFEINHLRSFSILGDLNLNDVCWATVTGHSDYSKSLLLQFQAMNLNPLVFEPTHKSGSTLDVILTSHSELFNVYVDSHLYSDHYPVYALLNLPIPYSEPANNMTNSYSLSSFSRTLFNSYLSNDYDALLALPNCSFSDVSMEEYFLLWQQTVMYALSMSCRIKTTRRSQYPYFYSSHSIHLINKLRTAEKCNYRNGTIERLKLDVSVSVELDKTVLLENLSPVCTRSCFKFLRSFSSNRLPNQMNWNTLKANTSNKIANLFNSYFSSVFQKSLDIPLQPAELPTIRLNDFTLNPSEVADLLSKTKTCSLSSDPVPTFLLNSCPDILAPLVSQLFTVIIKARKWPSDWKCSYITPIYKSGNPENVENYRPISILPQLSLILEKLLFRHIYPQVRTSICTEQHGFTKKRSPVTQLLPYLDDLYHQKDINASSYAIYFDFRKAFDLVPYHILLQKLAIFGFDDDFLILLKSYLYSRTQRVSINGSLSQMVDIDSGVPQGSVLGPLFFIIFMNDLPDNIVNSSCYLFADDSKLLSLLTKPDLQIDIDHFTEWAHRNKMEYNIDKCKSITFSAKLASSDPLYLNGSVVPTADSIKDLGIIITNNITWDNHIQKKLVAARKAYHFLKRSIPHSVSSSTKLMYYRLCVQSIILYGSQVWYPSINYRRKLELFNKECLFWVTGLRNYSQQLEASNTLPISFYLVLNDMVFLNKAINNKYDLNLSTFICFSKRCKDLRRSKYQQLLPVKRCRKFSTRDSFFQRVCDYSNFLAAKDIDIFDPTEKFKQDLMTYLRNQVPTFNLDRSCSWFLKCHCSICRS